MVLLETRAQGDLIVLDNEDGGDALYGREVRAFVHAAAVWSIRRRPR